MRVTRDLVVLTRTHGQVVCSGHVNFRNQLAVLSVSEDSVLTLVRVGAFFNTSSVLADVRVLSWRGLELDVLEIVGVIDVGSRCVSVVPRVNRRILLSIEDHESTEVISSVLALVLVDRYLSGDNFHSIVNKEVLVGEVDTILSDNSTGNVIDLAVTNTGIGSESLFGERSDVVGDSRSHVGTVVDRISVQEACSGWIRNFEGHGRIEARDQIGVFEDSCVSSGDVGEGFGEGVPDKEHLSLVQAVLSAHAGQEGGLVFGPRPFVIIVQLSEHLGVVGIVEAVPGVVVAEQVCYLSLVELDGVGTVDSAGFIYVIPELRGSGHEIDGIVTPLGHGVGRTCVGRVIRSQGVEGDSTRSPLDQS